MSASEVPEENRFFNNVLCMIDVVKMAIEEAEQAGLQTIDKNKLNLVEQFIKIFEPKIIIEKFIEKSHQDCWMMIFNKNDNFFLVNAGQLFNFIPGDNVSIFKNLYTAKRSNGQPVISPELKDEMWSTFQSMVKIAIKYIHKNREPYVENGNLYYGKEFLMHVDIVKHNMYWKLKL